MNRTRLLLLSLIIFVASVLILHPITEMFFWRDDYTILYKIQQSESASYPYQLVIPYFTPLYQWFGVDPRGYFVLGLLLFAVSSAAVFIFFRSITKIPIAFVASLLYATGLVALENMIQITYADVIPVFVTLLALSQFYLVKFIQNDKVRFFGISIALFVLVLEFFPHRAHLVYLYILATDLLIVSSRTSDIRRILTRQTPFFLLYLAWYVFPRAESGGGAGPQIAQSISILKSYGINSIVNFTNLLLTPLDILWPTLVAFSQDVKVAIGIATALLSLTLIRVSWRTQASIARVHAYSFFLVVAGLAAYLLFNPEFVITGISRYHSYTQLGFVLYIVSGFVLLRALSSVKIVKGLITIFLGAYIFASTAATLAYTTDLNKSHSLPAKRFYQELKALLPKLPASSFMYFDKTNTLPYDSSEFTRVGRLPTEAAFAAMYRVPMQNLRYTENFDDVAAFVNGNPEKIESIHSFFISDSRLFDTTKHVRAWLRSPTEIINLSDKWQTQVPVITIIAQCDKRYTVGIPPTITSPELSIRSVTPVTLQFSLRMTPLDLFSFTYPYYQSDVTHEEETVAEPCDAVTENPSLSPETLHRLIAWEKERSKQVNSMTASSYFPPDIPQYAADGDVRTLWTADVTAWNKEGGASLTIDLPQTQEVGRLLLTPGSSQRLPKTFTIATRQSADDPWQEIQSITDATMSEYEPYEVVFPQVAAKQILLTITQTNTRLAPQLAEISVLSGEWKDIALADIIRYRTNPYTNVPDVTAMQFLQRAWQYAVPLRLYWKKDKDLDFSRRNYVNFTALADGVLHTYTITIPAGGRTLEKVRLAGFIIPSRISLGQ